MVLTYSIKTGIEEAGMGEKTGDCFLKPEMTCCRGPSYEDDKVTNYRNAHKKKDAKLKAERLLFINDSDVHQWIVKYWPNSQKTSLRIIPEIFKFFITSLLYIASSFCLPQLVLAQQYDNSQALNEHSQKEIRVVMAAAFVSDAGISVYDEIFSYMGKKLGRKVVFVSGFSYSTINSMLDSGMVDIGFICGLPYVIKHDVPQATIDLLIAPVMKGDQYKDKPLYYSYVIVHKDSKFKHFSDLKNGNFVFNDEISNSGYNMPRSYLISIGETSGFFGKILRSGSHEESIRMVASGEADVSAVDSLVYEYDQVNNPAYIQDTRILKVLGPAGIPPVVVSTKLSLPLREEIRGILLSMNNDPDGRKILDKALVDRFTIVEDGNYDGIREMRRQALDSGYQVIR